MHGECKDNPEFRTRVYTPAHFAESALNDSRPCNGSCVFFCIMGQLESFFDPHVHETIAQVAIHQFSPFGRNDVAFLVGDEYANWPYAGRGLPEKDKPPQLFDKGLPTPATPQMQCRVWHSFPIVQLEVDGKSGSWLTHSLDKGARCMQQIRKLEVQHGRRYDWVVRLRADSHWTRMPFHVGMKKGLLTWNDQYFVIPREAIPEEARSVFNGSEFHHFKGRLPTPLPLPFYLWRTNKPCGVKEHLFHPLDDWLQRHLHGHLREELKKYDNKHDAKRAALKEKTTVAAIIARETKLSVGDRFVKAMRRHATCMTWLFTFGCRRYLKQDLSHEVAFRWKGVKSAWGLWSKQGAKLPGGDLLSPVLQGLRRAETIADLRLLERDAGMFVEMFRTQRNDCRTRRMDLFDEICGRPCAAGGGNASEPWHPRCDSPPAAAAALWNALGGAEAPGEDAYGLC